MSLTGSAPLRSPASLMPDGTLQLTALGQSGVVEPINPINATARLPRAHSERPNSRAAEQRDELAAFHQSPRRGARAAWRAGRRIGMVLAAYSADRSGERRWHIAIPAIVFGPGGLVRAWMGAKYPRH